MVHKMWQQGVDPDNCAIPYLTALGDLLGKEILLITFYPPPLFKNIDFYVCVNVYLLSPSTFLPRVLIEELKLVFSPTSKKGKHLYLHPCLPHTAGQLMVADCDFP